MIKASFPIKLIERRGLIEILPRIFALRSLCWGLQSKWQEHRGLLADLLAIVYRWKWIAKEMFEFRLLRLECEHIMYTLTNGE